MLVACTFSLCIHNAYADIPNNDHPLTFIGPTIRGGVTGLLTDTSGYSFAGEVAANNLRISGSVGWNIFDVHHLKLMADYLGQRMDYSFFNGDGNFSVDQGSAGIDYEFDVSPYSRWNPQFDLNAYYASAPNSPLNTQTGTFVNSTGVTQTYTDVQRLAGSNSTGISPGIFIYPWRGGKLGLALNYDNVRYNMKYQSNVNALGLGGTAQIRQQLPHEISIGAAAAVRQPFNSYQADIAWDTSPCFDGAWEFKVFGIYVAGKQTLPSTYNAGLSIDYFLDKKAGTTLSEQAKQNFLVWMAKPAVYIPQVLTIPDENVMVS